MALRGVATQSQTHANTAFVASPFVASHSIDGNFDTGMIPTSGACSYTENTPPAWWQVDLLEVYHITKVAITGRKEYSTYVPAVKSKLLSDDFLWGFVYRVFQCFIKKIWMACPFMGPVISLFWTTRVDFLLAYLFAYMIFLRFISGVKAADFLKASMTEHL